MCPWGWGMSCVRRLSADIAERQRPSTSINLEGYVGHVNLRVAVMGETAWSEVATPEQSAQMAALLDEAMRNGSLGLSTNLMDNDQHHRPIPSRVADDAEFEALFDVLGRNIPARSPRSRRASPSRRISPATWSGWPETLAGPRGGALACMADHADQHP